MVYTRSDYKTYHLKTWYTTHSLRVRADYWQFTSNIEIPLIANASNIESQLGKDFGKSQLGDNVQQVIIKKSVDIPVTTEGQEDSR